MATDQAVVDHALSYPYESPSDSFLLVGEHVFPLELRAGDPINDAAVLTEAGLVDIADFCSRLPRAFDASLVQRDPVLAYGSNGSPDTLIRKLGTQGTVVPVLKGRLEEFDIVFSSHFGPYGSIPATLQAAPGTAAEVFAAFMTASQAKVMHATEPNYYFSRLWDVSFTFGNGATLDRLYSYVTRHGILSLDGHDQYALVDIQARDRTLPQKTEREILDLVRNAYWSDEDLETFVFRNATEPETRALRTEVLKRTAAAFSWQEWEEVPV